jgi:glycosyltransferase involved in cell wall biosynthesis
MIQIHGDKNRAVSNSRPIKVIHVEVGGSYGGSLRELELYLRYSDQSHIDHDVLFYYPTPGMEKLVGLARNVSTLYPTLPPGWGSSPEEPLAGPWPRWKAGAVGRKLADLRDWAGLFSPSETVRELRERLQREKYDVVHVNNTFTYQEATIRAANRVGIPLIAHVRNPIPSGLFPRRLLRCMDMVVTVSEIFEKELCSWGLGTVIRTCHECVERPVADVAAAALRLSLLPSGGILVGAAGRLDQQKGYHDLIRAARVIVNVRPEIHFVIAGEGPLRTSLENLIAALGLADHFHLCGFRNDVPNFLAALDLFVCSSHWEGTPLVLIEAMALAKPVVSTTVGCATNVVIPGETGELVRPKDPEARASAILAALQRSRQCAYDLRKAVQIATEWSDPSTNAKIRDSFLAELAKRSLLDIDTP